MYSIGLDFETYCDLDLKEVGLDNYVKHPSFRVLWAGIADGQMAQPSTKIDFICNPSARLILRAELSKGASVSAHNAGFEEAVVAQLYPDLKIDWIDTAVLSRLWGGGSKLEEAAEQLLSNRKMPEGRALINKFSRGKHCPTIAEVQNDPDWQTYGDYCEQDAVLSMCIARDYPVNGKEQANTEATRNMNNAGWPVDVKALDAMIVRYEANKVKALDAFRQRHSGGAGELNFNSFPQLKAWCAARGVITKSFDEEHVEKMIGLLEKKIATRPLALKDAKLIAKWGAYAEVLDMLQVKQVLGGSSLSKLAKIKALTGPDNRLRYQYVHVGASQTRRTSGVGVQMQNLKRLHNARDMETLFDPAVDWTNEELAENLRQVFTAGDPHGQLIVGDFSSIESRGLAWLAGEEWKIQAYIDGLDIYKIGAAAQFKIEYEDVTKDQRTFGKVGELSCGYGAAAAAVQAFAAKMGIELTDAEAGAIVNGFRTKNANIVKFWEDLDYSLKEVMSRPIGAAPVELRVAMGKMILCIGSEKDLDSVQNTRAGTRKLYVSLTDYDTGDSLVYAEFHGAYLRGRDIVYHKARKKNGQYWSDSYFDPKTKTTVFYTIYGGKLSGILTQAMCRTLFFDSIKALQTRLSSATNAQIIGQFHDEIVTEWVPGNTPLERTINHVKRAMSSTTRPAFKGFPLTAEVNTDFRYTK